MSEHDVATEVELLTFRLADQEYAVDIMSVREIRSWTKATPLPHAPAYMKGVINLRGTVLPVMDLACRLGLEVQAPDSRAVIIVVHLEDLQTGLLVDAVSDIIALKSEDIQPPPLAAGGNAGGVVSGLSLFDERMVRVLDLAATIHVPESAVA